jgi:hypothetical protein
MEAGGGGAEEEEQVMSEVHLGCPPHFSGLHVSRFSFSSRPLGTSSSRSSRALENAALLPRWMYTRTMRGAAAQKWPSFLFVVVLLNI